MRKGVVAFGGMIVGLVLLVAAFLGPWYVMSASGTFGVDYHVGFFLTKLEARGNFNGQNLLIVVDYEDAEQSAANVGVNTDSFAVIKTAMYLTFFAIVTAVIAFGGMVGFVFQAGKMKFFKYVGGLFALMTFVLALLPAVYVMNTEFAKNTNGFWFEESILGVTITGGPGYAWYLMIVAAIVVLICAAAFLVKKTVPQTVTAESAVPPVH